MACRAIGVALLFSTLAIAGCGTAVNLVKSRPENGARSPFGGVRQDLACIEKAANGESGFGIHPKSEPKSESEQQHPQVALMLGCAADLPLSFIGDVVTWPYTVSYTFINQPTPVPPMTQAPTNPVQQPREAGSQPYPREEVLPEPRKLP